MEQLIKEFDLKKLSLCYDTNCGVDHRKGWSVTVNGKVIVEFADTKEVALEQTKIELIDYMQDEGLDW